MKTALLPSLHTKSALSHQWPQSHESVIVVIRSKSSFDAIIRPRSRLQEGSNKLARAGLWQRSIVRQQERSFGRQVACLVEPPVSPIDSRINCVTFSTGAPRSEACWVAMG